MGDTRAGHTFLLVNSAGNIVWGADYGGAPDYTMYLPVNQRSAWDAASEADEDNLEYRRVENAPSPVLVKDQV